MRRNGIVSALAVVACVCVALAAGEVKNLLENGSFEKIKDGNPAGWVVPETAKVMAENDNHFLRVTATGENKSLAATQKVKIDPGVTKLTLTAKMRGKDIKLGEQSWNEPRITLYFMDDAGEHVGDWPDAVHLQQDSADWKQTSVTVDVPPGAKAVDVRAGLVQCQGQVDFDDIRLEAK